MTREDLVEYQPQVREPMTTTYRDYVVMTVPAPIGGQTVLETLNILENFDLPSLEHHCSKYLHLLIECARHAFADRFRYLGDWEAAPVPIQGLLSKRYAQEIAKQVDPERAFLEEELTEEPWVFYLERAIHNPWRYDPQPRPTSDFGMGLTEDVEGTTHFNVVDKDWNVVCCTHFSGFETGMPEGTGVYFGGGMGQLIPKAGYANSVAGWKRPLTNDSPLLIFKDGKPILSVGAPGGIKIIHRVIQVTLNVLDFSMGIQEAITMPTIDASSRVTLIDSRIPQRIIHNLRDKGHRVEVVEERPGNLGSFARPSGILLDYNVGRLHGGVDVFRPVTALGY